jgi:hypothetical protein
MLNFVCPILNFVLDTDHFNVTAFYNREMILEATAIDIQVQKIYLNSHMRSNRLSYSCVDLNMPVTDLDSAIEDLYSIAINPTHAYHSNSQTALFLLSTLTDVIQSLKDFDIPNAIAYKLPICYILFDSALETGIIPFYSDTSVQTASHYDHHPILAEGNRDGI